ncbi:TylF/MycF/NovP-related O-methyltransferase [Roseibium sediminis]|uniref:TylF/MycF/NovP-related O-methyltransferase n=1 Tax=Roseibium sediminis TaxID=1775174 RepID=UPI001AD8A89E|nr:TylF/MycF/NovP-related O-methyltransferase [Roseibium sediminis]
MTKSERPAIQGLTADKVWDYENGYFWFSDPTRLNKALAQYELYKKIVDLPGDILELGVFKGLSLLRFASFRNCLEDQSSRKIIGFDTFGYFPTEKLTTSEDLDFIHSYVASAGVGLSVEELEDVLRGKNFLNVDLVKGNVFETIPTYLEDNPATRIALLHLDMDVLEPTAFALEHLYDRVVSGGVIIFDDYQAVAGATIAIDRFIADKGLQLKKLSHYRVPAYTIKP